MLGLSNGLEYSNFSEEQATGPYLLIECTNPGQGNTSSVIQFNNLTSATRSAGDTLTTSFDYYITDPDGWNGSDNVSLRIGQGNTGSFVSGTVFDATGLTQQTAASYTKQSTCSGDNWENNLVIAFTVTNDQPSYQTKFFCKNLQVIHKNSGGTTLETITYDFSASGNIGMIQGNGAFSPSNAEYSKGNVLPE